MTTVDVGVAEGEVLVVAGLVHLELLSFPGADRGDTRLDLVVLNRLRVRVVGVDGRAAGESPSTMNNPDSSAFWEVQSFGLAGMPAPDSAVLRRIAFLAFFTATRACAPARSFLTAYVGFLASHSPIPLVGGLLHE